VAGVARRQLVAGAGHEEQVRGLCALAGVVAVHDRVHSGDVKGELLPEAQLLARRLVAALSDGRGGICGAGGGMAGVSARRSCMSLCPHESTLAAAASRAATAASPPLAAAAAEGRGGYLPLLPLLNCYFSASCIRNSCCCCRRTVPWRWMYASDARANRGSDRLCRPRGTISGACDGYLSRPSAHRPAMSASSARRRCCCRRCSPRHPAAEAPPLT
jgi:hypothetical protein